MEKLRKVTHRIYIVTAVLAIVFGLFATVFWLCQQSTYERKSYVKAWCYMLDSDWEYEAPDGTVTPMEFPTVLKTPKGEPVKIRKVLPYNIPEGTVLTLISGRDTDVYIDGNLRYTFSSTDNPLPGPVVTAIVFQVNLTPTDAGKTLTVVRRSDDVSNGSINYIYLGNTYGTFLEIYKSFGAKFVASVLLVFFALAALIVTAYFAIKYKFAKETLCLALGAYLVGAWSMSDNYLYQYVFGTEFINGVMGFFFTMIIVFPFISFVDECQEHRYRYLYAWIRVVLLIVDVAVTILHFTGVSSYLNTMPLLNGTMGVGILMLAVTMVRDFVKKQYRDYVPAYIGMLGMCLMAIIEILHQNTPSKNGTQFDGIALLTGVYWLLATALVNTFSRLSGMQINVAKHEKASELKTSFLANMSHEIRTPVNAIMGMNEMILREEISDSVRDHAVDIKNASNNLLEIINDILDFSKIEAGKVELLEHSYDLGSMLHDVISVIAVKARDNELSFDTNIDENLPAGLYGDEGKIRQILINLLNNAVKYTKAGGVELEVSGETNGREVALRFTVTDTGLGIKDEDKARIFDQFARVEEEANRSVEGTGLGLAITKSYVGLMGGEITFESTWGEGSAFTVEIKQKIESSEPIGKIGRRSRVLGQSRDSYKPSFVAPTARILVVDDNTMNLKLMEKLLKKTQIHVDTAASGREALAKTKQTRYHMIILDHMMPEMDGIETLRQMREDKSNHCDGIPVIALTANAIKGAEDKYIEAGFDAYLSKPVAPAVLERMIKEMLPKYLIAANDE